MSEPELEDLPPDVRALLDEEARRPAPSAEQVERIGDGALREIERRSSSATRADIGRRFARGPLWFSTGVLVGALIVGALWRRSPPRTVVLNQVVVIHVDAASAVGPEATHDALISEAPRVASTDAGASSPAVTEPAPSVRARLYRDAATEAPDLSLRAERELIETAQSALARRQWRDAMGACEVHLRRFARAQLVEEREAIWVQALAGQGRTAEAWARAESFRRRFATSMLRSVVDRAAPPLERVDR
ncbi:MAG: hypothetical protein U0269_18785 [Polyangiales bacterium]